MSSSKSAATKAKFAFKVSCSVFDKNAVTQRTPSRIICHCLPLCGLGTPRMRFVPIMSNLTVLPSENPCEHDPIADSGEFDVPADGVYKWVNLNVASGSSIVVVADDDSDAEAWTATVRQFYFQKYSTYSCFMVCSCVFYRLSSVVVQQIAVPPAAPLLLAPPRLPTTGKFHSRHLINQKAHTLL
jgi:hypothetical protein